MNEQRDAKIKKLLADFYLEKINVYAAIEYLNRFADEAYNQALDDCISKAYQLPESSYSDDYISVDDIEALKKT